MFNKINGHCPHSPQAASQALIAGCFSLLLLAGDCFCVAEGREFQSLDGTWAFRLDPKSVGEMEQWFSSNQPFRETITVPGAWDAQGFGDETEKLRHNFIGKGWYKKEILVTPTWQGQRVFVCFSGVYRYAKVWVNGRFVGEHLGYVSNFEYEITKDATAGSKLTLAVEVDSEQRWAIDTLQGCADIIDHLFTYWGGIWGHISLEARAPGWIEDLFVQPQYSPPGCQISATVAGAKDTADEAQLQILSAAGDTVFSTTRRLKDVIDSKGAVRMAAVIPAAQLWTPETPHLYTVRLSLLQAGKVVDRQETRTGLRTIEIRDTSFYLNGKKIYLNGYGDDCVYPETMCPPSDKGYYLRHLRVAKSYGFNYVRHHSHFVTPEYYAACDEIGMLVSPELPIAYARYYNRAGAGALALYQTEWTAAIKRYRNHPSIFDWCMSNEMWEGFPIAPDLYRAAKELDPTRPVIDTDGVMSSGFVDGTRDRPTLDFYPAMFNILTTPLDNPAKFKTGKPKKPVITHEEGNYVAFPRLDQIELYQDNFKPFWLTPVKARIEQAGLWGEVLRWSENSERLYYLLHKENIEALRKNPYISGYHWWLLKPWYPGANGLVDVYDRPSSITPGQVRQFNGSVVILQDGLARAYRGGEPLDIVLKISNFSGTDFDNVPLAYQIKDASKTLAEGTLAVPRAPHGELATLGFLRATLPDPDTPKKVSIQVSLAAVGKRYMNEWSTWLYPAAPASFASKTPIYGSADLMEELAAFYPQRVLDSGQLPGPAVYVARQPSLRLLAAAQAGSCVLLLSPAGVFPTDSTSYKSAWWLGVFDGDSNAGTMVYDHPVTRAIAPDGWCDASWLHLLQGAQTILLDDLPVQPHVLIRALNTHSAPHPFSRYADFEYMWRNKSLLLETKVGNGSFIVSGLNFEVALRQGGPEGPWLLTQLIKYAATLPKPKLELPLGYLRQTIEESPFTKGPLVSGFDRLSFIKGETVKAVSYRDPEATLYRIRQEEPEHRIAWETAPVPQADQVVFVFAGGFPFKASPPVNPGFTLTVNNQRLLDFDTVKTATLWHSNDKKSALFYVPSPSRPSWGDTMGLFYVSVPCGLLTPGKACQLGVRSRGSENDRWFGLNPYQDILNAQAMPARARSKRTRM